MSSHGSDGSNAGTHGAEGAGHPTHHAQHPQGPVHAHGDIKHAEGSPLGEHLKTGEVWTDHGGRLPVTSKRALAGLIWVFALALVLAAIIFLVIVR